MATDTDNSIISITDSCVQVATGIGRVIARPTEGRENPSYEVSRFGFLSNLSESQ